MRGCFKETGEFIFSADPEGCMQAVHACRPRAGSRERLKEMVGLTGAICPAFVYWSKCRLLSCTNWQSLCRGNSGAQPSAADGGKANLARRVGPPAAAAGDDSLLQPQSYVCARKISALVLHLPSLHSKDFQVGYRIPSMVLLQSGSRVVWIALMVYGLRFTPRGRKAASSPP